MSTNITSNTIDDAQNGATMSTITGENMHEPSGTTTFTTDANIVTTTIKHAIGIDRLLHSSSSDNYQQDLREFLKKPFVIQSGVLSGSDTVSTFSSIQIPMAPVIANPLISNKIDGFLGWRATMVIRWEVNANRFQGGRYMLTMVPTGGSPLANTSTQAMYNAHTNSLTQRTQLQRLELDVNCDTEGVMRIPYNSALNFWPVSSTDNSTYFGNTHVIQIFPYVALQVTGGTLNCSYTIWLSFEDAEFSIPAAPQMGRIMNATEKEQQSKNIGQIQSTMMNVSKASSILGGIPLLSTLTNQISWYSDILGNAAGVFGWSKPTNLDATKLIKRVVFENFSHVDGPDNGGMVAASSRNQVGPAPGFSGTDIDEMDFSYIATIPAWFFTQSWSTAQTSGTQLFFNQVSPGIYNTTRTSNTLTVYDLTPVAFVQNYFNLWRGSMTFKFKIVKTEFHSGRLAFCFFPYEDGSANANTSYTNSQYVLREIVDIRMQNEITFTIPYVSSLPWKNSYNVNNNNNTATGVLCVYIVDPLVAPANVTSSISIIGEISGGPDIAFASPVSINHLDAVLGVTPQMGNLQDSVNVCREVSTTIGSGSIVPDRNVNDLICIGESISSFRTLLKMTSMLIPAVAPVANVRYTNVLPFCFSPQYSQATLVSPNTAGDLYGTLCSIYCYSRGSVRLKFLENTFFITNNAIYPTATYLANINNNSLSDLVTYSTTNDVAGGTATIGNRRFTPQIFHQVQTNLGSEITVPQYHRMHSRVNSEQVAAVTFPFSSNNRSSLGTRYGITHVTAPGTNSIYPIVNRSGGDDVNFGTFISIPPMVIVSTLVFNP